MLSAQVLRNLQQALGQVAKRQDQVASGKRILAPSDDPTGSAQALAQRSKLRATEQYQKNVGEVRGHLESVEATIQSVVEHLTRAQETAVRGAGDTLGALERQGLAVYVDQLLESLVAEANTREGGRYLFGGQESTTAPYSVTRNVNGQITAVAENPRGISDEVAVEIGEGESITLTVPGPDVFGDPADPTYAFDVLIRLRDSLDTNDGAGAQAAIDELETAIQRGLVTSTVVGYRLNRLDLAQARLEGEAIGQTDRLSRIEDIDMAQAVLQFQQQEIIYQAALAAGARIIQPTLLDFLR